MRAGLNKHGKPRSYPTQGWLREWFDYDPLTGIFIWKKVHYSNIHILGKPAGTITRERVAINVPRFGIHQAHRLAWIYVHGVAPGDLEIDHKDCNPLNNAIDNLRTATSRQQKQNSRVRSCNRSGLKGAYLHSCRLLKFGQGELEISDRIISITHGHRVYASKMIEEIFPADYRRTIPETGLSAPVVVYRESLMESLSRLRSVGDFIESNLIDISVAPDEISISVTGAADGAETIECEASESKMVCVRSTQLLDALKVMRGDKLHLHITGQSSPMRVVDPSEPTAINVLMPCASTTRRAEAA